MTKSISKIKAGIKSLTNKPYEIISGIVVPGSVDTTSYSMSVQASDDSEPIQGVMLNAIVADGNGVILIPKDGSNVVIGSIDGPGEWGLIKASELTRAIITMENVTCVMDNTQINIQNGNVLFNISDSVFKMNTASESLYQLLKDCFTYLTELTVPTPAGTSSVPVNAADFNNLLTRLNNLLTS
jgi:hypothetical protein